MMFCKRYLMCKSRPQEDLLSLACPSSGQVHPPPPPRKGFFPLEGRSQAVLCYQLLCAPTGTPSSLGPWCSFLFFLLAISGWISDVSKTHRASRDF